MADVPEHDDISIEDMFSKTRINPTYSIITTFSNVLRNFHHLHGNSEISAVASFLRFKFLNA
jgi:hypothetical protein